jgi:hypothetical protein
MMTDEMLLAAGRQLLSSAGIDEEKLLVIDDGKYCKKGMQKK